MTQTPSLPAAARAHEVDRAWIPSQVTGPDGWPVTIRLDKTSGSDS